MIKNRLYSETLQKLKTRNIQITLEKIAEDTGLTLSWLQMFSRERITNPSVNKIETLCEYLSGNSIIIP